MIKIEMKKDKYGCLIYYDVKGHAETKICAAVSHLSRTIGILLISNTDKISLDYSVPNPGALTYKIKYNDNPENRKWLSTITSVLCMGLQILLDENPKEIDWHVQYLQD